MAMTTRCPHCGTAFKVVVDQLRVRNGLVRCGVCARVFDGYAAVIDGPVRPPAPASKHDALPDDGAEPPGKTASPVLSVKADAESPSAPPTPRVPSTPSQSASYVSSIPYIPPVSLHRDIDLPPSRASHEPVVLRGRDYREPYESYEPYVPYRQDEVDNAEQQARDIALPRDERFSIDGQRDIVQEEDEPDHIVVPGEVRTRYDDLTDAGMAPPIFMDEVVRRRRSLVVRLWAIGCVLGLVLLGLQWIYLYRTSIATTMPALRPVFESVCAQLGCQLGYARRLERISIIASSLQPQSGAALDDTRMRLLLSVTMRNRYDKPQPWPAFMLQLTDLSDTVVVRKVVLPENYLPPGTKGPFPAGGEQSITVPLQVDGLHVNGYQLDKFFP